MLTNPELNEPATKKLKTTGFFKASIKVINSYTSCNSFYYHGIGLDLTKLTLINEHGILTAKDGKNIIAKSFTQMHGVNQHSQGGGTNKQDFISISIFESDAFRQYNKEGVSFMLSKSVMQKSLAPTGLGLIEGEKHIQGSILKQNVFGLCFPGTILKQKIGLDEQKGGFGIGKSVLQGSSLMRFKIEGFIQRLATIFEYENQKDITELLTLAKDLDNLYNIENLPNLASVRTDHFKKIGNKKLDLENYLEKYFADAVKSKYSEINTVQDYLQHPKLNGFKLIVLHENVYIKPATINLKN